MLRQATLAFICQSQQQYMHVFKLGCIVPTFTIASNSVILSLAAYLTWRYPSLHHPSYPNYPLDSFKKSQVFPSTELSFHPLYEAWCDIMCNSMIQGEAIRSGQTLYLVIKVQNWLAQELISLNWQQQTYYEKPSINRIFDLSQIQIKEKTIILMNFATSQLRQNQLLPKIHLPALIIGTIFNNEKWSYYCILKGEVPTKNELIDADTLIFPGSSNSVLDNIAPVELLLSQLKEAYHENPSLKIMSICYGHQLVARIYGANIVRKNRFEGHELVAFNKSLTSKYPFLQKITDHMESQFIMPEHHQDYVQTVPVGFDLIATSNSCYVEAMVKTDGRILSLQFHPEYLSQYTIAFTKRAEKAKAHYHISFALEIQPQKLNIHHKSCTYVRECMKAFIDSQP